MTGLSGRRLRLRAGALGSLLLLPAQPEQPGDPDRDEEDVQEQQERDERGQGARASEVGFLVARQNGKGGALEAIALYSLFIEGGLTLWTAHELKTSDEAYLRVKALIHACPDLAAEVVRWDGGLTGPERADQRLYQAKHAGKGHLGTQKFMDAFNQTLYSDLDSSGLFRMVPKSMYPIETPQRPQDFRPPLPPSAPARKGAPPPQPIRQGPWLTDWSQPPASAAYLAFGYAGVQDGRLVVFGWLFNVQQNDVATAQVLGKMYFGSVDEEGARKTAHEFAADILALLHRASDCRQCAPGGQSGGGRIRQHLRELQRIARAKDAGGRLQNRCQLQREAVHIGSDERHRPGIQSRRASPHFEPL